MWKKYNWQYIFILKESFFRGRGGGADPKTLELEVLLQVSGLITSFCFFPRTSGSSSRSCCCYTTGRTCQRCQKARRQTACCIQCDEPWYHMSDCPSLSCQQQHGHAPQWLPTSYKDLYIPRTPCAFRMHPLIYLASFLFQGCNLPS